MTAPAPAASASAPPGPSASARAPLQKAAAAWCLLMVAVLTVYQFVPGFGHPPMMLYLIFTGVWLFGAAMLWWVPLFGGAGTTAYGLLLGALLLMRHETRGQNVGLALASFVGAGLAAAMLVAWLRKK